MARYTAWDLSYMPDGQPWEDTSPSQRLGVMTSSDPTPEERISRQIASLGPAPEAWVQAAREIPVVLRALDDIHEVMLDHAGDRAAQTAQLEAALERAGVVVTPQRLSALERGLTATGDDLK